jgi:DtxR family transcriptional regulator, Mn-dependent transcriptional regulator
MEAAAKLSSSLEDYLEAIYHLECRDNSARASDIARRLDVSGASVTGALHALSSKKLINYKPYQDITLTAEGRRLAGEVVSRHQTLHSFFVNVLDVEEELAQRAACRMEHSLPRTILERLQNFVEYIDASGNRGDELIEKFKSSIAKG